MTSGTPESRVTILGSGTFLPHARRASAAHLIEEPGVRILLDCGSGTLHGMDQHNVDWQELTHVCLTHFHIDHVGDLPALLTALRLGVDPPRTAPLTLVGPPGLGGFLRGLEDALGATLLDPGFPVHVVELAPGEGMEDGETPFRLTAHPTPHTPESVAFRWEGAGGVVAYTGDTGPSREVALFLAGADVLIAECTQADPPAMDTHLSPRGVAELAGTAGPGLLVLTHVFPPLKPHEAVTQVKEAGYEGRVAAGSDGLCIPLGR